MTATVEVKKTAESVETAPATKGTIVLGDFVFEPPADFDGNGTYAVENQGNEVHELALFKIADGKTLDDVKGFILTPPGTPPPAGPPPFTEVGGTVGLSPQPDGVAEPEARTRRVRDVLLLPRPDEGRPAPRARGDDQGVHGHLIRRRDTGGRRAPPAGVSRHPGRDVGREPAGRDRSPLVDRDAHRHLPCSRIARRYSSQSGCSPLIARKYSTSPSSASGRSITSARPSTWTHAPLNSSDRTRTDAVPVRRMFCVLGPRRIGRHEHRAVATAPSSPVTAAAARRRGW